MQDADGMIHANSITIKNKEKIPGYGGIFSLFFAECGCLFLGSLSIVGVGFVKTPPQFYENGPFYV